MKKTAKRSAAERLLDEAIELTFPASDPIAVDPAFLAARERKENAAGTANEVPQTKRKPT